MIGIFILCILVIALLTVAILKDQNKVVDSKVCVVDIEKDKKLNNDTLYKRFNDKIEALDRCYDSVFLFKGLEFHVNHGGLYSYEQRFMYDLPIVMVSSNDEVSIFNKVTDHNIFEGFLHKEDWKVCFVEAFIKDAKVQTSFRKQLGNILEPFTSKGNWVEIGDGLYYAENSYGIYRFSDWEFLNREKALEAIEGLDIKICENPKKIYWKHFLELKMKAKKQREIKCKEFIDTILSKQKEYNDLQYKYEMLPSAPITDYESFTNFCKTVNEKNSFAEYEITNMLLLKRNEQN